MMEEQLSGLLPSSFDLDSHIDNRYPLHGTCETSSFALCWYLAPDRCYAAQSGEHTVVLYNQALWIDLHCGALLNKKFTAFQKLKNFSEWRFNFYWGENGTIAQDDYIFKFIKISLIRDVKIK